MKGTLPNLISGFTPRTLALKPFTFPVIDTAPAVQMLTQSSHLKLFSPNINIRNAEDFFSSCFPWKILTEEEISL
jgi:hypothetical protein